jgi:pimeloyl-ACP methyl ester carboxylesterase
MAKIQVIPGVYVEPRIADTARGKVEFDLTDREGPVILSLHGGLGGADQGRLNADWLAGQGCRILSPSRPGYLGTPLDSGTTVEDQAGLLAALFDTSGSNRSRWWRTRPAARSPTRWPPGTRSESWRWGGDLWPQRPPPADGNRKRERVRDSIFLSTPGQKLMQFAMERLLRAFLSSTLSQTGYLPKPERKAYVDHLLNSPQALAYIKGITRMMGPYDQRAQGVRNDFQQGAAMSPLPFANITCPTLIVHGTRDALAEFYDGVRAHEHIKGAERHWIEGGDHLAFWLSPEAPKAQAHARAVLDEYIRS